MKKFICFLCVLCMLCIFSFSAFAVASYSTYSDVTYNTTYVQNLLSLRDKSDVLKDYVVIRTETEYILFISDEFDVVGDTITCPSATLICYRSSGVTGNATRYYSVERSDGISISVEHIIVSNFIENASKPDNTDYSKRITIILLCILGVIIFWVFRRFK